MREHLKSTRVLNDLKRTLARSSTFTQTTTRAAVTTVNTPLCVLATLATLLVDHARELGLEEAQVLNIARLNEVFEGSLRLATPQRKQNRDYRYLDYSVGRTREAHDALYASHETHVWADGGVRYEIPNAFLRELLWRYATARNGGDDLTTVRLGGPVCLTCKRVHRLRAIAEASDAENWDETRWKSFLNTHAPSQCTPS
jgi:hypothetical protein